MSINNSLNFSICNVFQDVIVGKVQIDLNIEELLNEELKINKKVLFEREKKSLNEVMEKAKLNIDFTPIGSGGFANVYRANRNNINYAVKIVNVLECKKLSQEVVKEYARNEMIIMINLKNKNTIKCFGTFSLETGDKAIIMEFAVNRDLSYLIDLFYSRKIFKILIFSDEDIKREPTNSCLKKAKICESDSYIELNNWLYYPSETFVRFFIRQIVDALIYLNLMNFTHLDLKLENCLLMRNLTVKLIDFFLSKQVTDKIFELPKGGSPKLMSPEYYITKFIDPPHLSYKLDYFSLGIMIIYFFTKKYFVTKKNENGKPAGEPIMKNFQSYKDFYQNNFVNYETFKIKNELKKNLSDELFDLIKILLHPDIKQRADIQQISKHRWLNHKSNDSVMFYYTLNDNDFIKFLLELQKIEESNYLSNRFSPKEFFTIPTSEYEIIEEDFDNDFDEYGNEYNSD